MVVEELRTTESCPVTLSLGQSSRLAYGFGCAVNFHMVLQTHFKARSLKCCLRQEISSLYH